MSEDLNVFPNAKPIILGADTHAASLTGNVSNGTNEINAALIDSSINRAGPAIIQLGSRTATVTSAENIIIARFIQRINGVGGTVTYQARVRRDNITSGDIVAEQLVGVTGDFFTFTINVEDTDVSVGSHTYFFSVEITLTTGGAPVPFTTYTSTPNAFIYSINDTHAAILTGSNTQRTHEQAVLPA